LFNIVSFQDQLRLQNDVAKRKKKKIRRSDPARMHRLRLKFVEQAKKYLGIPYAKKYFEPGSKNDKQEMAK
jgi:hypothetical protein